MAGAIVSVAQQKGGAGKTTLAVQLGVAWLSHGPTGRDARHRSRRRACSPGSTSDAAASATTGDGLLVQGLSGWRLGSELGRLRGEYDLILVDSPPHAESDARAAIREADLVLVPCQPNALDVWASAATLELAQTARTEALLVLNRVPPRGRAAEQMRAEIAGAALAAGGGAARQPAGVRGVDRRRARGRRDRAQERRGPGDRRLGRRGAWPGSGDGRGTPGDGTAGTRVEASMDHRQRQRPRPPGRQPSSAAF